MTDPYDDLWEETHATSVFDDELDDIIEADADEIDEDVYEDRDVY